MIYKKHLVHDMGIGIMGAVKEVFQNIPDYICHFHFLRDIGKDLLLDDYQRVIKSLKDHKIRKSLRQKKRYIGEKVRDEIGLIEEIILGERIATTETKSLPEIAVYTFIQWIFEAPRQSKGYGFPFDTPHLDFYNRLKKMHQELSKVLDNGDRKNKKSLIKVCELVKVVLDDKKLKTAVVNLETKKVVFNKLREALRIADPDGEKGLNDEGESDIETIEDKVKKFKLWLEDDENRKKIYAKMIKQIEKYWDKLFTDPIVVSTNEGKLTIVPQRTNNILERYFFVMRKVGTEKNKVVLH
ncbi:hypothetical protein MHK_001838 [Candidatus Magnetomorum sp. HK-1]|nr:hypothetical protein MHK_001838 [Candidatus Magnetomorum sp. HK-1]